MEHREDITTFTCDICHLEVAAIATGKFPAGWHFAVDNVHTTTTTGVHVGPVCWLRLTTAIPVELPKPEQPQGKEAQGPQKLPPLKQKEEPQREARGQQQ